MEIGSLEIVLRLRLSASTAVYELEFNFVKPHFSLAEKYEAAFVPFRVVHIMYSVS
jgi:hypothetical protein